MCVLFQQTFVDFASDGTVNKSEYRELLKIKNDLEFSSQNSYELQIAEHATNFLKKQKVKVRLNYTIPKTNNFPRTKLRFVFSPTYDENDVVFGYSKMEVISNISQSDNFSLTFNDVNRCGAASILNAYILLNDTSPENSIKKLMKLFNMSFEFPILSYKNIHYLQENIYLYSNTDKSEGLTSGYNYKYDSISGDINQVKPTGEIYRAAKKINLKMTPLIGKNIYSIHDKKESVVSFFTKHPEGVLLVGVSLNQKNGEIKIPNARNNQNHFILVFRNNGSYYIANTGVLNNGDNSAVRKLNKNGFKKLIYLNTGNVHGLSLR